ncbi:MAG: ABC transporter ATP-binding protein [Brotaphodocola sp.]
MKLVIQYIRRHIVAFLAGILCLSIEAAADLMQPTFMAYIVDRGVKQADVRKILHYGMIMLGIAFLGAAGVILRNYFSSYVSRIVGKEMRSDLYRKVQTLSFENIDRLQTGMIITRITNDVTQIQDFVNSSMRMMFKTPITCAGAVLLIMIQMPEQIPLMLCVMCGTISFIVMNMRVGYPKFGNMQKKLDRLNIVSREFLSSVRVVKAFQAEEQERDKFYEASEAFSSAGIAANRVIAVFSPLTNLTINLGIVIMIWTAGMKELNGIGRLMACVNYMTQIVLSMTMMFKILNTAVRAEASANRIQEIFDEVPAQCAGTERANMDGAAVPAVSFEHVSFCYAGAGQESLTDLHFSVRKGETIGIIGPTGSGKTTLINLISRFYDATKGRVLVEGQDVTQIEETMLREKIAVVQQKALLFTGTIEENLRWGKKNATEEEMEKAAKIACADGFIHDTKDGYQTLLGQGGVNLSGGQKQRLTLARALLKHSEILILDDCTSALDAETERKVLNGLRKKSEGMTVFLISQRVSTVMKSDRILCLENGCVQGFGTHQELMETCGTYQDFYRSQIGA